MAPKDDPALGSKPWWNSYFMPEGGWERNGGRTQTRVFAETFLRHVRPDGGDLLSLCDVGCALGESIRLFHLRYPGARLTGIDVSETSVDRCRAELGAIAEFRVCPIDDLEGFYDMIYISAVLEHFADWAEKTRRLVRHARRLGVMVPFMEQRDGKELVPDPATHHQHTFTEHSFDFLVQEGLARSVRTFIDPCPGAWGWTRARLIKETAKNFIRPLLGKSWQHSPKMLIVDIQSTSAAAE
jgi:hypothetical protein